MSDSPTDPNRRAILLGAGAAVGAAAGIAGGIALSSSSSASANAAIKWDAETDVICVGSGSAAGTAAATARLGGAEVIILEKMPMLGGTTGKSGGVTWIPNHRYMRERGVDDKKEDCLKFLARFAYPNEYYPDSTTLGLNQQNYSLLEAFYDHGADAIDMLEDNAVVHFREFKMWQVDMHSPDYADHLPENKVPRGRALEPAAGAGSSLGGGSLAAQLAEWLEANGVPMLTEHQVTSLIKEGDRVIGVRVDNNGKSLNFRARKGVIFGSGGYAHNTELVDLHQPGIYGACAMPGSTGDFIGIAAEAGARMGPLHTAWRTQVVLEEALENRAIGLGAFVLPGDSMIVVNKYGKRVTNEKRNYNDRTKTHFTYDPTREEFTNHMQFMIFDHRSLDAFGGAFPFPSDPRGSQHMISADSLDQLADRIDERLAAVAAKTGNEKLDNSFKQNLAQSVERFNGYARDGVDPEYNRGLHDYDSDWHLLFSARRDGTEYPVNPHPNLVMHPFTEQGPYYAFILAPGALDTCGGPMINRHAQIIGNNSQPIPGLFGAGNCVASPTRQAYAGAGGTIGLAVTFGYIAGQQVLKA